MIPEFSINEPAVDITAALSEKSALACQLNNAIEAKKTATSQEVKSINSRLEAQFLTRPLFWTEANPEFQQLAAEWCSQVILQVYGEGYPLPNKHPGYNLKQIQDGSLLLYLGLMGPANGLSQQDFYSFPDIKKVSQYQPVATAAIILNHDGKAELGRTGRRSDCRFFDGGVVSLERVNDWSRNRYRLLEMIHLLTSDIRAAADHQHSPLSGAVQNLIIAQMGMKVYLTAPLYNVNGLEPFLGVHLPRSQQKFKQTNQNTVIFTPCGQHTELLQALWQHQLDEKIQLETHEAEPYEFALSHDNGPDIYGSIDVIDHEKISELTKEERKRIRPIAETLAQLENTSPVVMVKVEAQTPQSAATQRLLIKHGYTVCGVTPAMNADYLTLANGNPPEINHYLSPAYIYLAKLGDAVLSGRLALAPAYYPGPEDAHGVDIHGANLRRLLYQTDAIIRQPIT